MLDGDYLTLWCALNRLMANYWAEVDENGGEQAHQFYVPDGHYAIGNNRFEGEEKIRAFYARRRYGTVMTPHLISNLRGFDADDRHARMVGVMSLYRADGRSTFHASRPPPLNADLHP